LAIIFIFVIILFKSRKKKQGKELKIKQNPKGRRGRQITKTQQQNNLTRKTNDYLFVLLQNYTLISSYTDVSMIDLTFFLNSNIALITKKTKQTLKRTPFVSLFIEIQKYR
jgi:hypothetical protein